MIGIEITFYAFIQNEQEAAFLKKIKDGDLDFDFLGRKYRVTESMFNNYIERVENVVYTQKHSTYTVKAVQLQNN